MNLAIDLLEKSGEDSTLDTPEPIQRTVEPVATVQVDVPKNFRLLKYNERVNRGDFVMDEHLALAAWEGPTGFRAGSFVKSIYRSRRVGAKRKEQGVPTTELNGIATGVLRKAAIRQVAGQTGCPARSEEASTVIFRTLFYSDNPTTAGL